MNAAAPSLDMIGMPGPAANGVEPDEQQCITFKIGDQEYAVDIMLVREIKGWTETTALPQAPPYVRGVINLRDFPL